MIGLKWDFTADIKNPEHYMNFGRAKTLTEKTQLAGDKFESKSSLRYYNYACAW